MSSRFLSVGLLLIAAATTCRAECPCDTVAEGVPVKGKSDATTQPSAPTVLHVYADPNNLPFSNDKREGFENKIAALVARELGVPIQYTWMPQRMGFFRESLKNGDCDLVLGAPAGFEKALTTAAYYRSSYVFVTRKDRKLDLTSLDDPRLKQWKIGIQTAGGTTPAAHALANRGLIDNVVGFALAPDEREQNPQAQMIDAVADGQIDVAISWGPPAGYFARKLEKERGVELAVVPVSPEVDGGLLPFAFDISMAVRRKDTALRDRINGIIASRHAEIDRILDDYGIPHSAPAAAGTRGASEERGKK